MQDSQKSNTIQIFFALDDSACAPDSVPYPDQTPEEAAAVRALYKLVTDPNLRGGLRWFMQVTLNDGTVEFVPAEAAFIVLVPNQDE